MPLVDDEKEQKFLADELEVGKPYQAHIIDAYRDDNNDNLFFVTFYLPKFKDVYKEKGKGLRVHAGGKEKRLAIQFFYNVGFPGKTVEPERKSNVADCPARQFEIEKLENWLGLRCLLKFKEERAYNPATGKNDGDKVYKNIDRQWDIKTDGIQPWFEGENLNAEQVKELQEKFLKQEDQYNPEGGNKSEEDLPF